MVLSLVLSAVVALSDLFSNLDFAGTVARVAFTFDTASSRLVPATTAAVASASAATASIVFVTLPLEYDAF